MLVQASSLGYQPLLKRIRSPDSELCSFKTIYSIANRNNRIQAIKIYVHGIFFLNNPDFPDC